jgi:H+/Cl- antiporter ClcA
MKALLPKRLLPKDERLIALAVSALVCPGAGQCMAGRWLIGLTFAIGFTVAFLALAVLTLWPLLSNFGRRLVLLLGSTPPPLQSYHVRWIIFSLALATVIYLLNVLDAWLQVRRASRI